jgi:catechol 2,3-dioxygenase-like lactoylglutathione lyase family enzyme
MVQITSAAPAFLVADVFETAEYYRDVLGFSFDRFFGQPPSFVIVERGDVRLMFRQPRNPAAPRASNTAAIADFSDVFLYVDDVEALATELREKGADIVHGPTERPIWNGKELQVRDCNGWVLAFGQSMGTRRVLS